MGQILSKKDAHERPPSFSDKGKKVIQKQEQPHNSPVQDKSIDPARLNRLAELSQRDSLQRTPGVEGYTEDELYAWRDALKGKRLFEGGEPISMEGIRQKTQFRELALQGHLKGLVNLDEAPDSIRRLEEELRQEALVPRSEKDYECENLPVKSVVEGIYERDGFYYKEMLSVTVNRKGIVTSVWNG